MTDYVAPEGSERFAELVHRQGAESDRQRQRLRDASTEEVKRVLRDRDESREARGNAILVLRMRRDPEMTDLLLELFDDPDQDLWQAVIRSYHPADPRIVARLVSSQNKTASVLKA